MRNRDCSVRGADLWGQGRTHVRGGEACTSTLRGANWPQLSVLQNGQHKLALPCVPIFPRALVSQFDGDASGIFATQVKTAIAPRIRVRPVTGTWGHIGPSNAIHNFVVASISRSGRLVNPCREVGGRLQRANFSVKVLNDDPRKACAGVLIHANQNDIAGVYSIGDLVLRRRPVPVRVGKSNLSDHVVNSASAAEQHQHNKNRKFREHF
jgi:hypothetical protein